MTSRHPSTIPKWAVAAAENAAMRDLADCAFIGVEPETKTPRLPTRITPSEGGQMLSAQSTAEIIFLNQRLIQFAGMEVAYGVRQEFSDLRRLSGELRHLTKVRIEPFQEGSLVIPCVLESEPVEILVGSRHKRFTGHDLLDRFSEVLEGIGTDGEQFDTSLGMLQAVRDLNQVLRRDAESIEFVPISRVEHRPITVNRSYVSNVEGVIRYRIEPTEFRQEIAGYVTAVDLTKQTFNLRLADRNTISGTYTDFVRQSAIQILGRNVTCVGEVQYVGGNPQFVRAFRFDVVEAIEE